MASTWRAGVGVRGRMQASRKTISAPLPTPRDRRYTVARGRTRGREGNVPVESSPSRGQIRRIRADELIAKADRALFQRSGTGTRHHAVLAGSCRRTHQWRRRCGCRPRAAHRPRRATAPCSARMRRPSPPARPRRPGRPCARLKRAAVAPCRPPPRCWPPACVHLLEVDEVARRCRDRHRHRPPVLQRPQRSPAPRWPWPVRAHSRVRSSSACLCGRDGCALPPATKRTPRATVRHDAAIIAAHHGRGGRDMIWRTHDHAVTVTANDRAGPALRPHLGARGSSGQHHATSTSIGRTVRLLSRVRTARPGTAVGAGRAAARLRRDRGAGDAAIREDLRQAHHRDGRRRTGRHGGDGRDRGGRPPQHPRRAHLDDTIPSSGNRSWLPPCVPCRGSRA